MESKKFRPEQYILDDVYQEQLEERLSRENYGREVENILEQ